jgi:transcriptional regulator with XRE-family HTH domain
MYLSWEVLCYIAHMQTGKFVSSKTIGEKIKFRRQDLGMSQERLAEILGVSYGQVQRYENGKNKLNVENIQLIAKALSVPLSFFFSSDLPQLAAEPTTSYTCHDEKTLLKHFRDISGKSDKQLVVHVARLAARK